MNKNELHNIINQKDTEIERLKDEIYFLKVDIKTKNILNWGFGFIIFLLCIFMIIQEFK